MTSSLRKSTIGDRVTALPRRTSRLRELERLVPHELGEATVSVALPGFLKDVTEHQWRDERDGEHRFELTRRGRADDLDLDALIGRQRRALRDAFRPFAKVSGVGFVASGRLNRYFACELGHGEPWLRWVAALVLGDELVSLEYTTRRRGDAVFTAIVRSLTSTTALSPPVPGFLRRSFGAHHLDLPSALRPPRQFSFEGGGVRLVLDRAPLELTRADIAFELGAEPSDELLVTEVPALELDWNGLSAQVRGFQVKFREPTRGAERSFRLARVFRGGTAVMSLLAQGGREAPELDPLVSSVLLAIRPKPAG
jgi:hypothetical protein